jgi:FtsZ-binding cell division protein ZapB
MLTVYGVTLIVQKPRDAAAELVLRETVGRLISPWLETTWPEDRRTNSTQVNARSSVTDKVFRIDVSEQHASGDARQVTLISMFNSPRGDLCVDVRREVRPTGPLILPRTRTERPPLALTSLIGDLARELRVRDAQQVVSSHLSRAATADEGAALGALVDAPSRRLPLVIECTSTKGANAVTSSDTARLLTGIAHVHQLTSAEAEHGFNDYYGSRKASSSWVLVAWPRTHRGVALNEYPQKDDDRLVDDLIAAAVGALPILPRPTSRTPGTSQVPIQQIVANTSSPEVGELRRKNQDLEQRVNELQSDYEELYENLTTTEHLSAKMAEDRDRYQNQLTSLLTLRDDMTQWNSTSQVLQLATKSFTMLHFQPDLTERLGKTQFSPATNQRIFENLLELNNLAARLRRGDIEPHLFNTYCAEKFNFASSVSDNAINKFGSDYTTQWNGSPVQLGPHIRCNEARIYFYVDPILRQVVIGHVGEHLRDKSNR